MIKKGRRFPKGSNLCALCGPLTSVEEGEEVMENTCETLVVAVEEVARDVRFQFTTHTREVTSDYGS